MLVPVVRCTLIEVVSAQMALCSPLGLEGIDTNNRRIIIGGARGGGSCRLWYLIACRYVVIT